VEKTRSPKAFLGKKARVCGFLSFGGERFVSQERREQSSWQAVIGFEGWLEGRQTGSLRYGRFGNLRYGGLRIESLDAHVAQSVEHVLGKDEVISSILIMGSILSEE
jgi:hypothetical protein